MQRVIDCWRWFLAALQESNLNQLKQQVDDLGEYDLHDVLRQEKKIEWCEWHLSINESDKAVSIAEEFHQRFQKLRLSSSIIGEVVTIKETFLNFMPKDEGTWKQIRAYFNQAHQQDNPFAIITAYTFSQVLSQRLNKHSAVNTYHALKLYCTSLNCPILAQTQEYTEAFTKILFHSKLDQYLVREKTVYRGIFLEDRTLVENYTEGATIITTTFLSTSIDPAVANYFGDTDSENGISVFSIYNIKNTNRRTALDLRNLSFYRDENEILILRYVPFTIKFVQRTDEGRKMTICFDECQENRF